MIGSYATTTFKEPWYSQIILPSFNPPSWVFAPVWSTLYFLMSLAIWKVWIKSYEKKFNIINAPKENKLKFYKQNIP